MRRWILFACLILIPAIGAVVPAAAQASTGVTVDHACELTSEQSCPLTVPKQGVQFFFFATTAPPKDGSAEAQAAAHVTLQVSKWNFGGGTVDLVLYEPGSTNPYLPPNNTCQENGQGHAYFTGNNFCSFNLPAGTNGWWRAGLEPEGSATGSLTMTYAANQANTELSSTIAAGPTINVEGQYADFTFDATEGEKVKFSAGSFSFYNGGPGGSSGTVNLVFYEPDGSLYTPNTGTCYFNGNYSCTISSMPAGGQWFAFLEPQGASVGSLTLAMS